MRDLAVALVALPAIMVAPNGARRTRLDHPSLPLTIAEIVADAAACHAAGAGGLHAHVRDGEGAHVLDAGLYRELIDEMERTVPSMLVQITTEAVGKYAPAEQQALVFDVVPHAVSVALREMLPEPDSANCQFYRRAQERQIAVQHILYEPAELERLATLIEAEVLPGRPQCLFVLGRHTANQQSDPAMLDGFLQALGHAALECDWAACAFGKMETACLRHARNMGGKVRVGFENSLWNEDGSLAASNAERVAEIAAL